jgi:hypothetical protein
VIGSQQSRAGLAACVRWWWSLIGHKCPRSALQCSLWPVTRRNAASSLELWNPLHGGNSVVRGQRLPALARPPSLPRRPPVVRTLTPHTTTRRPPDPCNGLRLHSPSILSEAPTRTLPRPPRPLFRGGSQEDPSPEPPPTPNDHSAADSWAAPLPSSTAPPGGSVSSDPACSCARTRSPCHRSPCVCRPVLRQ